MSLSRQNAAELLSRGISAARTGLHSDRHEAEHYLEWVLATDSDRDQQVDAWYWLSRITDDPVRKRECLENGLAINPSHPEARRDLAILDGRLKPEQMRAHSHLSGLPVAPGETVVPNEIRRFKCPRCGASITYDASMGQVRCQFCGTEVSGEGEVVQEAAPASSEVSEQDWVAAIYTETGHRWVIPQSRVLQCQGCGAVVTFAPARTSTSCTYCAAPYVLRLVNNETTNLREPDGIVPFTMDPHVALACAQRWLVEQGRRIGVPDDLPALATLHMPQPVYLPFWTFDIGGEVRWSGWVRNDVEFGIAGSDDLENVMRFGGAAFGLLSGNFDITARSIMDLAADKTGGANLVHTTGAIGVTLDDVTIPATKSLPSDMLSKLKYKTTAAVPYEECFLSSWPAEIYTVSLADASLNARQVAIKDADSQIALQTDVVGKGVNSLTVDRTRLVVDSYKLLLLPVWTTSYSYRGQTYRLVISGQTGQVEGDEPPTSNPMKKLFT